MNTSTSTTIFPEQLIRQTRPTVAGPRFHGVSLPSEPAAIEAFYRGLPCVGWAVREACRPQANSNLDRMLFLALHTLGQHAAELAEAPSQKFETRALSIIQARMAEVFGPTRQTRPADSLTNGQPQPYGGVRHCPIVLVAAQDATSRFRICQELSQAGLDARPADNGAEALLTASFCQPDLILLDADMEHVDGLQACVWLKASRLAGHPPVFMLCGANDDAAIARGLAAGGDDILAKPFDPQAGLAFILHRLEILRLQGKIILSGSPLENFRPQQNTLLITGQDLRHFLPGVSDLSTDLGPVARGLLTQPPIPTNRFARPKLETARKDMAPLLHLVAWVFTPQAARRQIALQLDAPNIGLIAWCDEIRLQRVLENLLANAIKFSPARSTITLGARRENGRLHFWVDDEGPGVPETEQAQLFNAPDNMALPRFMDELDTAAPGLAMCQRIVNAHDGVISMQNRPTGGAHFEFSLPEAPRLAVTAMEALANVA